MSKSVSLLFVCLMLIGCSDEQEVYKTHARLANAGSLDGPYGIIDVYATDTFGGRMGFGFGAVNGFPGASAAAGGLGVPNFIEGHWVKEDPTTRRDSVYFRISSPIDSELAKKKIETLENYYENYSTRWGTMQFAVDGPKAMLFFTLNCFDDCTPRKNADPNGWVIKDPLSLTDVVLLFDGLGETSPSPYPKSRLDTRFLYYELAEYSGIDFSKIRDVDGQIAESAVEMPVYSKVAWSEAINPEDDLKAWKYRYYKFEHSMDDLDAQEAKIQAYRQGAFDGYLKQTYMQFLLEGDNVKITYSVSCYLPMTQCTVTEDPQKRWEYIPEIDRYGVVLFSGKADMSDKPFDGIPAPQ
ncbi:hypothetical protein LRP50_06550 [Enterovibrio sp. ZSDZ42]|uniref:DUF3304 domain-containing protein n=1 Tax=Enterovibrio gelatinilyticus TaxID=2899819 RepID=A0ABT5QXZ1_9GAMM|nr:hypothetical protein [Enterovibrio sp. ZSDZ42]MDD1792780.1 hypothetical protein [Enterovibrio sp. ZSDZ42]